jgi:predicted nucleotidyltransferase
MNEIARLAEIYQKNIYRATEILREAGCTDVFLFGSLAAGEIRDNSDIDLAVRGCPKGQFFHILGRLLLELDYPVDLVNLDRRDAFGRYLEKEGKLIPIG